MDTEFVQREIEHILNNIKAQPKQTDPYEHFVFEKFFTDEFFQMLLDDYERIPFNKTSLRSKICCTWQDEVLLPELQTTKILRGIFYNEELQRALLSEFNIKRSHVTPGNKTFIEFDRFQHKFYYRIHPDAQPKLMSMIIYLPEPEDNAPESLGTRIYNRNKQHVKTVPYKPNVGIIFAPMDGLTFHSMQNDDVEDVIRKSVQVFYGHEDFPKASYLNPPRRQV